jgi:hypothetical protein
MKDRLVLHPSPNVGRGAWRAPSPTAYCLLPTAYCLLSRSLAQYSSRFLISRSKPRSGGS